MLEKRLDSMEKKIDKAVPFATFSWAIGIMVTILIIMLTNLTVASSKTREQLAELNGKLAPFNIEFKN